MYIIYKQINKLYKYVDVYFLVYFKQAHLLLCQQKKTGGEMQCTRQIVMFLIRLISNKFITNKKLLTER